MNKFTFAFLVLLVASAASAQTKTGDMKGMDMAKNATPTTPAVHEADGTIKKINAKTGYVLIAHGPVNSLSWPPMTMSFKVKEKTLLNKLAIGKKINFRFVQDGEDYVMTTAR